MRESFNGLRSLAENTLKEDPSSGVAMANGVALMAEWLRPVVDAMTAEQFSAGYVQLDEWSGAT